MKFELMIQADTLTPEQFEQWVEQQEHCTLEHGCAPMRNNECYVWIAPHSYNEAAEFGNAVAELMTIAVEGV